VPNPSREEGHNPTDSYPIQPRYDGQNSMDPTTHSGNTFPTLLGGPIQATNGSGHTPLGDDVPSVVLTNVPMNNYGPSVAWNTTPVVAAIPATPQHKFPCPFPMCPKTFDRLSRADACLNAHLGRKPYVCLGTCGNISWSVTQSDKTMLSGPSNAYHQHHGL